MGVPDTSKSRLLMLLPMWPWAVVAAVYALAAFDLANGLWWAERPRFAVCAPLALSAATALVELLIPATRRRIVKLETITWCVLGNVVFAIALSEAIPGISRAATL